MRRHLKPEVFRFNISLQIVKPAHVVECRCGLDANVPEHLCDQSHAERIRCRRPVENSPTLAAERVRKGGELFS